MRLLNIESSPRGPRSASISIANAFIDAYGKACPALQVDTLNVWEEDLPEFDGKAYKPLLGIPRALVIHVRGQSHDPSTYAASPGFAHQADYLDFWLRFIGVKEIRRLMVEHTWDGRATETIARGRADAAAMAADF
ncbi:azoreductase [Achromobacter xylosoxidans]|uniref:NAD(P)H-dependent oxidoreductase n=1 Tax=Alcaligenes xylosoxydans xylosoxydans TaxID=85698 RepID=UPI0006C14715|nr:NAD(P)H-dependent oxidoreductase [Achromobacter xylosoxidans]CUI43884.1 azoreductase [Achromobacter xylosoxidans]